MTEVKNANIDDFKKLWKNVDNKLISFTTDLQFLNKIGECMRKHPYFNLDSLAKMNLYCKVWLIDELKKVFSNLGSVCLLCGWYGILAKMIDNIIEYDLIVSYDIDSTCVDIANELNFIKFISVIGNIDDIKYNNYNTIINTSCEHTDNHWFDKIPKDKLVILQSNNYSIVADHVNCVYSLEEMKRTYPLNNILYEGVLDILTYQRYMLIGIK